MIRHTCPNCGAQLDVPDEYAGQTIKCGGCGATTQCPMNASPPSIPVVPVEGVAPLPSPPSPPVQEGSKSQAVASLVLAILSFACMGPVGSIPAIILGHFALSNIRKGRMPADARGLAVAGLVLGYINIAILVLFMLVIPALAFPALSRSREASRRASCQNNLKQMGIVYKMFANESKDMKFPHLSGTPGQLMSAKKEIYPEYLTDVNVLICPSLPDGEKWREKKEGAIDDESYFYLGYAVNNEVELLSFCDAYKERILGGQLDGDLQVPEGKGSCGGSVLYQLREGIERFYITDINNPAASAQAQSSIPILIERPENHVPKGGNVLYMDGHVEFLKYGTKWPMTDKTINALLELDAMGK